MSWSYDDFIAAFDAEAGDIATIAVDESKVVWFNEGQTRLTKLRQSFDDLSWGEGDQEVALPGDFKSIDRFIHNLEDERQPWRVWGNYLVLDNPLGASTSGGGRVYYLAEYTPLTVDTVVTDLNSAQDTACLYYSLSRFYRLLASNRAYYKRYATLVGQNAVTMTDLQQEADRYYQDFLDTREDLEVPPIAPFYTE